MPYQKILLPTDLSTEGERALTSAAVLARQGGARLALLHVIENVGSAPVGSVPVVPYLPGTEQEIARATRLLEERARMLSGLPVDVDVIVAPSVPHAIADYARAHGFDMIALSSHGRTGFRRLVLGSVTEALLRQARVPVLVIPRPE